jgi:protein-S-isoprenylcysteine O-methyltransferase Ste14
MTALRTLIFTIVAPGTMTVLIPYLILRSGEEPFPVTLGIFHWLGVPVMLIGAAIYLWTAGAFTWIGGGTPLPTDAPKVLVVRGLYRYVRNPMYIGVLSVIVGEAVYFSSPRLLIWAAIFWLIVHVFVIVYEEPHLRKTFGASYEEFLRTVPRWIPKVGKRG